MAVLNSFLCCFDLETGGIVISWLGMIGSVIGIVGMIIFGLMTLTACGDGACAVPFIIAIIALLVFVAFFWIYRSLNVGVKTTDHGKVLPALIVVGISTFLGVTSLFGAIAKDQTEGIGGAIVYIIIEFYCFLILRELYVKFKSAKSRPAYGV